MVFHIAIERAEPVDDDVNQRVLNLIDSITYSVFTYTSRGLFEVDKLTFTSQVAFQILLNSGHIDPTELDFLLRFPAIPDVISPVDFLSNHCWGGIKALSCMEQFRNLDRDLEVCLVVVHSTLDRFSKYFSRGRQNVGRSLWTVNVPRKRDSPKNGRIQIPYRNSA